MPIALRRRAGDTESTRLWKFAQRSVQTFLTSHGVHFTIDNQDGTQVVSINEDGTDDGGDNSGDDEVLSRDIEGTCISNIHKSKQYRAVYACLCGRKCRDVM